jgi:membrane-bound lytic murein transglycosylase B
MNVLLFFTTLFGLIERAWSAPSLTEKPEVQAFIQAMSHRHHFDAAEMNRLFSKVKLQDKILESMAKPYEAKPWYAYRKLFLTEKRIQGGRNFMNRNAAALTAAERRYGVPPEMITAILGIESSYGENPGPYRVIDALSTLAFAYPKRASFFRRELESFLILCREERMNPEAPLGSYAGAMGLPQFMPSSYRGYAADGDGDQRRDIWNNPADAIASIANYFIKNGWKTGEPIAVPASISDSAGHRLASKDLKPTHTVREWRARGTELKTSVPDPLKANLIELEEETGPAYWLGLHNFFVITHYNHSALYAMAAYELSQRF